MQTPQAKPTIPAAKAASSGPVVRKHGQAAGAGPALAVDPSAGSGEGSTSFLRRKTMDPQTIGVLITATEYAVTAIQRMIQESVGEPTAQREVMDRYVDLVFGLEVNFVFPNLPSEVREQLVALMKIRNTLAMQLNGLPQWRTPQQKLDHDRLTADLKSEFFRICRELQASGLEKRLDRVQRQILQEEFLSIVVEKEDSTKLFFRNEPGDPPSADATSTPAADPDPVVAPAPPAKLQPRPARILVLDRHYRDAEAVARWLGAEGYEPVQGGMDFESFRTALGQQPDLLLVSYETGSRGGAEDLPLDGATVMNMLRGMPALRSLPVIALAPSDDPLAKPAALAAGALACLRKPLERHRLLGAIHVALEGLSPAILSCVPSRPGMGRPSTQAAA